MQKKVVRNNLILMALLFSSCAFAADMNNELLKMDFDQTSDGGVKVNIYTDKPYNDQIIVNKKPDNKYVILLPETTNSMSSQPDISGISSLNNVDVKTQQYSSLPGKGYTKITIDSKKPVNVVPQAYVTTKLTTSNKKTTKKPYVTPQQVQMSVPQRVLNPQRAVTNSDFTNQYSGQTLNNSQPNYIARPQQTSVTKRETPVQQIQRTVQQYVQPIQSQTETVVQQVQSPQIQEQSQEVVEETQNKQEDLENNNQAVDDAVASDDDISEDDLAFFKKIIRFKQKVAKKIKKLLSVRISFSSFMTVLQFILLIVLVKFISDLVQKVQSPNEQPVTRRLIHNNEETFEPSYPSYSNMDVYNTNRSNFEEDSKEGFNVTPLSTPTNFASSRQNLQQQNLYSNTNYRKTQPVSVQNDFYQPLSKISKEEKMSIFDENSNDIEKTIFKNPLTSISKQDEDTLFDEEEPSEQNSPFVDNNFSSNNNDDFFNYTESTDNEEDFFIFEDEEDDEDVDYQEDYVDEDEDSQDEYEYSDEEYYDESEEYEDDSEDEYVEDNSEEENTTDEIPAKVEVDPFEHLSVQSKYVIDSNRGFAQVSVDGINALIGYVGSKISVIRKFKEDVTGSMQVRLNEQPDAETMIYIIKLGSYKTLVEVKSDSIRQLLDL